MHPFINIAVKAAKQAGTIIVRSLDRLDRIDIHKKSANNDFVTNVDKAAEEEIVSIIRRAYPDHAILAEESGEQPGVVHPGVDKITWVIDPLDGTLNFIHGFPQFAVSIAVQRNGVTEQGVVYDPVTQELFTASKGEGAHLNERRIRVSTCTSMELALLGTGFAYKRTDLSLDACMEIFLPMLKKAADLRRAGAAALDLAYVAAGRLDGFWEVGLQPWDIAAGALLIKEAGGFVTDFNGEGDFLASGQIIAATRKIFPKMFEVIKARATVK